MYVQNNDINPPLAEEFFFEFFRENWICYSYMTLNRCAITSFRIFGLQGTFFLYGRIRPHSRYRVGVRFQAEKDISQLEKLYKKQ
jgi:hypothetical protein